MDGFPIDSVSGHAFHSRIVDVGSTGRISKGAEILGLSLRKMRELTKTWIDVWPK